MREDHSTEPTVPTPVAIDRHSGVLLHPTSLPGRWGIGDLGREAGVFLDLLRDTHQSLWQVLPLGPPALNGSPYSVLSATAGNPLLISLDLLAEAGLLEADDQGPAAVADPISFPAVAQFKVPRLRSAFTRFRGSLANDEPFHAFCEEHADWLEDYALFMAIKEAEQDKVWTDWPRSLALRHPEALRQAGKELHESVAFHKFTQYVFRKQWSAIRRGAHDRGIRIVGDIPFYVALDSSDVWSHPGNFALDPDTGEPRFLAGVPPDYFSSTGQLWNMPVYDWPYLRQTDFAWWLDRFRHLLEIVDIVRVDHFRGFAAYWQVPQGATTAIHGEWIDAPGEELFAELRGRIGTLPIWAEDLGLITADVDLLRQQCGFPGMKVLQFAFDESGAGNNHLPFHYERGCVCYTATHDNDTTRGWWDRLDELARRRVLDYTGATGDAEIHWSLIRLAMSSVANDVIIPWQDVLGLGSPARLNVPGTETGNWTWRFDRQQVTPAVCERLAALTATYGRAGLP
jgi:4-alpha-glucanotransferase